MHMKSITKCMETGPEPVSQDLVPHRAFSGCPSVCLSVSHQSVVSCSSSAPGSRPGTQQVLTESLVGEIKLVDRRLHSPECGGGRDPCRGTPEAQPRPGSGGAVCAQSSGCQERAQAMKPGPILILKKCLRLPGPSGFPSSKWGSRCYCLF